MKKILAIALIALLTSCESQPFTGFLVCKEQVKHHMSNERPKIIQQAVIVVPRPAIHRSKPRHIPSEWKFYVANKYGTRCFNVDSMTYQRYKVGDRITMKGGNK